MFACVWMHVRYVLGMCVLCTYACLLVRGCMLCMYCVCMSVLCMYACLLVCGFMVKRDLFTLHLIDKGSLRWSGTFHYTQSGYPAFSRAFLGPQTVHCIEGRLPYPPCVEVILEIPPPVHHTWLTVIYVSSHLLGQYLWDFSWINFSCSRELIMWGDRCIICSTE